MKPKLFIGSSVEGLSVAYAIQSNMMHASEPTVWSQGVFELNSNTLTTLIDKLEDTDFAVFVFSPDDVTKLRNTSSPTVRDNVLFEFGLFLGKLGKDRVFFIRPSDTDLHLPTDLLGITPGTYQAERSDENLEAATGPVCNKITQKINKIGLLNIVEEEESNTPEIIPEQKITGDIWLDDVIDEKYADAVEKLDREIEIATDLQEIINLRFYRAICLYRTERKNIDAFEKVLDQYPEEQYAYIRLSRVLMWENFMDKALFFANKTLEKFNWSNELSTLYAEIHKKNGNNEEAIASFQEDLFHLDPKTTIQLAHLHKENKNLLSAREVIHKGYLNFPNDRALMNEYAAIAFDLDLNKISLYFYNRLSLLEPKNSTHQGYIGNVCIRMDLNDKSLQAYRKAEILTEGKEEWIISNIGNLLRNRGLYSEAETYFRGSLIIDDSSEYALDRLASTLKQKNAEQTKYDQEIKLGKKELQEYSAKLLSNSE